MTQALPPALRKMLLETSEDAIPPALADAIRRACSGDSEVEAAYVCSVAIERDGQPPEQRLELGVKLTRPIGNPRDLGESPARLLRELGTREPGLLQQVDLAVLADRAVSAWRRCGVRIYARGGLPQPGTE